MSKLSQIRSILSKKPSYNEWDKVAHLLDGAKGSCEHDILVEYVQEHTESFPWWICKHRSPYLEKNHPVNDYFGGVWYNTILREYGSHLTPLEIFCPPGFFFDGTLKKLVIDNGFWMMDAPITWGNLGCIFDDSTIYESWSSDPLKRNINTPVNRISFLNSIHLCNALSEKEGLEPAYEVVGSDVVWDKDSLGYRLPTCAEWKYAARCHCGAWPVDLVSSFYDVNNLPTVRTRESNSWGFSDMRGLVWEWVWSTPTGINRNERRQCGGIWSKNRVEFENNPNPLDSGVRPVRSFDRSRLF